MLTEIKRNAARQNDSTEDYIKDGLRYCSRCETAKEVILKLDFLPEAEQKFPIICSCRAEQIKRTEQLAERHKAEEKRERTRRAAFGKSNCKYLSYTFELDDKQNRSISNVCRKYVERWAEMKEINSGILFYGEVGTGKTYLACAIANALIDRGVSAKVTNLSEAINELQSTFEKQRIIDSYKNSDLLVIDDLGIERNTEYGLEQAFNIIDSRARINKPTLFTTNLTLSDIENPDSLERKRIYDRVLEMCPIKLRVDGESRRAKKSSDKRKATLKAMGLK